MIKALLLIFEPMAAWGRVAQARRGLGFILGFYLLPMMLIVAVAEGFGLVKWGRLQFAFNQTKRFTVGEAVIYEAAQTLLMLAVILAGAHLIKMLGDTFRGRNTYAQAFTVAVYGLSPLFLLRLLDAFPSVNPWLTWGIGIMLTFKILYHGVPMRHAARSASCVRALLHEFAPAAARDGFGTIRHGVVFKRAFCSAGKFRLTACREIAILKMKTLLEGNLLKALVELDNAVKSMPAANPKPTCCRFFRALTN